MAQTYHEKVNQMMTELESDYRSQVRSSAFREAYATAYKACELARRIAEDPGEPKYMRDIYAKHVSGWESRRGQMKERMASADTAPHAQESPPPTPTTATDSIRSDISFRDIAGLKEVKDLLINKVIKPLEHPEILAKYKKKPNRTIQILLYGPPGTGKTMFAEALANELNMTMHRCKASEIIGSYLGESTRNMRAYMDGIINDESPRILAFIDEFDAVAGMRTGHNSGADGEMNRVVNELLQCIDAMVQSNKDKCIVFVATTNRPWSIDPAILRGKRLDTQIYVGLPDLEARRFLVQKGLGGSVPPKSPDVDLEQLAKRLQGYSSADISTICEKIADQPLFRHFRTGMPSCVTQRDIERVLASNPTSVSPELEGRYLAYNRKKGFRGTGGTDGKAG